MFQVQHYKQRLYLLYFSVFCSQKTSSISLVPSLLELFVRLIYLLDARMHLVAIAKLHLQLGCLKMAGSATPLALFLLLGFRILGEAYTSAMYESRLFFFRLGQIAFNTEPLSSATRLQRAIRLISQTISNQRRTENSQQHQEALHALSMLTL